MEEEQLQTLLADRSHLEEHTKIRVLVLAGTDGLALLFQMGKLRLHKDLEEISDAG